MIEATTDQKNDLKKAFETTLKEMVELVLIPATLNGQQNSSAKEFLTGVTTFSDKIKLLEESSQNNEAPLIKIALNLGYSIEFLGMPNGFETQTFFRAIALASARNSSVLGSFASELEGVKQFIEVFVLPTCANCPPVALFAIASAIAWPGQIKARITMANQTMVHAKEFGVFSVPHVVLGNDKNQYRAGIVPVPEFVKLVKNSRR